MFFITIILVVLAISIGSNCDFLRQDDRTIAISVKAQSIKQSEKGGFSSRITGGIAMDLKEFPRYNYQLGMYITKKDGTVTICGGALIHEEIAVTAGHCVYNARVVAIFMGTFVKPPSEYFRGAIRVKAINITLHEDYNNWTLEDDIALIHLTQPVKLSQHIGIISLASYRWTNCESGNAFVSGWGKTTNSDYSIPSIMNYLQVDPMSYEECHGYYDFLNRGKQLCSSGDLKKGICQGDSGGPYAFEDEYKNRFLCGINSFVSLSGCINDLPKGYTSIAYYNDNGWICKNSKGLVGCFDHKYSEL